MMRVAAATTQAHRVYRGVDLHASTLYLHVLDANGRTSAKIGRTVHHFGTFKWRSLANDS